MKLQAASKKEIKRMAKGALICSVLELAAFLLLHVLDIIPFSYRVIVGIAGGVAVSLLSFTLLCRAVEQAAEMREQKAMKARMQLSYNLRLFLQAGWVVLAFLLPFVNLPAAALPLLFPTFIILYLQKKGKLVEPSTRKNPPQEEAEEEEDRLESFEA